MLNSHLFTIGRKLGYIPEVPDELPGLCAGISAKFIEASLLREESTFVERIEYLRNKISIDDKNIQHLKSNAKNHKELSERRGLWEILGFYENVMLYQFPFRYNSIFKSKLTFINNLTQSHVQEISQFAGSEELVRHGGLKRIYSRCWNYSKAQLIDLFADISHSIQDICSSQPVRIGMLLNTFIHKIAVVFDTQRGWILMDIEQWSPELPFLQIEEMVNKLFHQEPIQEEQIKKNNGRIILNLAIFGLADLESLSSLQERLAESTPTYDVNLHNSSADELQRITLIAAQTADWETLKTLIHHDVNMNCAINGYTPLGLTTEHGNLEIVQLLVEQGKAIVNLADEWPAGGIISPLFFAISGHIDILCYLISQEANTNVKKDADQHSILYAAAAAGQNEIVEILLSILGHRDVTQNGSTILHAAALSGDLPTLEIVLDSGIDINSQDNELNSSLHFAVMAGHVNIVRTLIQRGSIVDISDNELRTPLHTATLYERDVIINLLIKYGASLGSQDSHGDTPLHLAAMLGHMDMVHLLIQYKAELTIRNKAQQTPVYAAIIYEQFEAVNILIKHIDINALDVNQVTPLYIAGLKGNMNIINLLLRNSADAAYVIHLALASNEERIINHLQSSACDFNTLRIKGRTVLSVALALKRDDVAIKYFMNEQIVNVADPHGQTPLFVAAVENNIPVVMALLAKNASCTIENRMGFTPLSAAEANKLDKIAEILRNHIAQQGQTDTVHYPYG